MKGILARYLFRETAQTCVVVTLVLLLILGTNQFADVIGDAAANKLPRDAVLLVMGLTSVQYLTILVPVGLFLAIMLSLARLYRDNEMAAIMACGVGPGAIYKPLLLFAAGLAIAAGYLALEVGPSAVRRVQTLIQEFRESADLGMLEAGRFTGFADDSIVLYAESVTADGELAGVFVQRHYEDGQLEVIVAERAAQAVSNRDDVRLLRFFNGKRYEGKPGESQFRVLGFKEHGIPIELPPSEGLELEIAAASLMELWRTEGPESRAELQWRLSVPLSILVLTILAVPLSKTRPREGRYGRVVAGILAYIIYVELLAAGKIWVEQEEVPVWLGMWWIHGLFLMAALILLWRQYGFGFRLPPVSPSS